jgi:hypothetical protein
MDRFDRAIEALSANADSPRSFSAPIVSALAITGASVSTIGIARDPETLSASNDQAARLDELQFDLGEGPCWDTVATRRPVFEEDVRTAVARWPALAPALADSPVRALHAFPLLVGSLQVGVLDLYSAATGMLDDAEVAGTNRMVSALARLVLREELMIFTSSEPPDRTDYSRRIVHQAVGMVIAQLALSSADALLVLQGHAFAAGRTVKEVSQDVIDFTIDFSSRDEEV